MVIFFAFIWLFCNSNNFMGASVVTIRQNVNPQKGDGGGWGNSSVMPLCSGRDWEFLLALLLPGKSMTQPRRRGQSIAHGNTLSLQLFCNYFTVFMFLCDAMQIPGGSNSCHEGPISGHLRRTHVVASSCHWVRSRSGLSDEQRLLFPLRVLQYWGTAIW